MSNQSTLALEQERNRLLKLYTATLPTAYIMVTDSNMEIVQPSHPNTELEELIILVNKEILRALGVPLHLCKASYYSFGPRNNEIQTDQ